jgi:hypothetical protein
MTPEDRLRAIHWLVWIAFFMQVIGLLIILMAIAP